MYMLEGLVLVPGLSDPPTFSILKGENQLILQFTLHSNSEGFVKGRLCAINDGWITPQL